MKISNRIKRSITLFMTVILLIPCVCVINTQAASESELKNQISSLQDKINAKEKEIAKLQSQKAAQEKYIDAYNEEIDALESQKKILQVQINGYNSKIDDCNAQIDKLNAKIEDNNRKIEQKKAENQKTYDLLKGRLRSMYMYGEVSELEAILGAKDLATLLMSTELVSRASKKDNELIEKVKNQIEELNKLQEELEADKAEINVKKTELEDARAKIQASKDDLTAKENAISSKRQKIKDIVAQLDSTSAAYKKQAQRYEDEMEACVAELDNLQVDVPVKPYIGGGKLGAPTTSPVLRISSSFGYRKDPFGSGATKYHGGIDITGSSAYGKPVYASEKGTVATSAWHNSYGNYIIIAHDNGLYTLYAHLSARKVSAGQRVTRGQKIGEIGSTGNSTGPHLHFEVRTSSSYSSRVNPMNYLPSGYYHY